MPEDDELIPTSGTLLSRIKDWNDNDSWRQFFDTYWKLIYRTAQQAGLSAEEAQDVVQETVLSVSKGIGDFRYDPKTGSFKSWLLKLTRWRIVDQLRKRQKSIAPHADRSGQSTRTATVERIPDPAGPNLETFWDTAWEKNLTDAALERVKQRVDPRQFQVFELFALKEWPARKVAQTLRVSAASVYVTKHRLCKLIRKEVKALEGAPGKTSV